MKISVIIPACNEEAIIASNLRTIRARAVNPENIEIIVVDGASEDQTIARARQEGAKIVRASKRRRSIQMNEGAAAASGEMLYFLHADTKPPRHFDRYIIQSHDQGFAAGCFQLSFDSDNRLLAFYSWCTRFDIDAFRFGDQSIFVHKQVYESTGGFRDDYHLMEGHEFLVRLKQRVPFLIGHSRVTTSARKYLRNGILWLQAIFMLVYLLYKLGVKQSVLHSLYQKLVH